MNHIKFIVLRRKLLQPLPQLQPGLTTQLSYLHLCDQILCSGFLHFHFQQQIYDLLLFSRCIYTVVLITTRPIEKGRFRSNGSIIFYYLYVYYPLFIRTSLEDQASVAPRLFPASAPMMSAAASPRSCAFDLDVVHSLSVL